MIDIEKIKKNFKIHAEKYDMNDIAIIRKFYHSYRVMDFCMLLAKYNNFNDDDTNIAILVGLLHDYSRFEQWTNYKTYSDIKSIDHGNLATERLFKDREILNYCENIEYYDEIYDAIKYHNKYSYPEYLSEHNKLLCKIIRDADKLDIFRVMEEDDFKNIFIGMYNKDTLDYEEISQNVYNNLINNKCVLIKDRKTQIDCWGCIIGFIFDLNFKTSLEYIKEKNYIDVLIDRIDYKNQDTKQKMEQIRKNTKEYIEKNIL